MPHSLRLPPRLNSQAAGDLYDSLVTLTGQEVDLDASHVTSIGGMAAQVLLAAQSQWKRQGVAFRIVEISGDFKTAMADLGLGEQLEKG